MTLRIGLAKSIKYSMNVFVETIADKRVVIDRGADFNIKLLEGQEFKNEEIKVKALDSRFGVDDSKLAIPRPIDIEFKLHWDLDISPRSCPPPGCPMIDPRIKTILPEILKRQIKLQSGCKDTEKCQCSLSFTMTKDSTEYETDIVSGAKSELELKFRVSNDGIEPSYEGKISFSSDVELPVPNDCVGNVAPSDLSPESGSGSVRNNLSSLI